MWKWWVQTYDCYLLHKIRSGCSSQPVSEGLCVVLMSHPGMKDFLMAPKLS